jgi:predicted ATP-grasp superfamily ATP-dependent carboligase
LSDEPVYRIYGKPGLKKSVLIAGWAEDAGHLGMQTLDYIMQDSGSCEFGEIRPEDFFAMAGVNVEDDVAVFPQSKFYVSGNRKLVIFKSSMPRSDWYRFLNAVLYVAQKHCGVKEIYTVGAMLSFASHTMPRLLMSIVNSREMKANMAPFNVVDNTDYETPIGQKPTLSSYLSWLAGQRGINAANLWVPVPFYLLTLDDPRAVKRLVYFFNTKFDLGIDFTALDLQIAEQNNKIAQLFRQVPEIESFVRRLEVGEGLDTEEAEKLSQTMADVFRRKPKPQQ